MFNRDTTAYLDAVEEMKCPQREEVKTKSLLINETMYSLRRKFEEV